MPMISPFIKRQTAAEPPVVGKSERARDKTTVCMHRVRDGQKANHRPELAHPNTHVPIRDPPKMPVSGVNKDISMLLDACFHSNNVITSKLLAQGRAIYLCLSFLDLPMRSFSKFFAGRKKSKDEKL